MRRAPIVIATTVAGLAGVLAFHTSPPPLTIGSALLSPKTSKAVSSAPPSNTSTTTTGPGTGSGSGSSTTTPPKTTTSTPSGVRNATGGLVNYNYGEMSVEVTVSGTKITNVQIATLSDGGNFRSVSIDQQAIPILESEVISAQNANIQGVSGATYTSEGFITSLQSALSSLGL